MIRQLRQLLARRRPDREEAERLRRENEDLRERAEHLRKQIIRALSDMDYKS